VTICPGIYSAILIINSLCGGKRIKGLVDLHSCFSLIRVHNICTEESVLLSYAPAEGCIVNLMYHFYFSFVKDVTCA